MNESIKAPEGIPTGAITEGERMSTDTRRGNRIRSRHRPGTPESLFCGICPRSPDAPG